MKRIIIWIAVAALSVGAMVGAYGLYNKLSEGYKPEMPSLPELDATDENEAESETVSEYLAPDFTVYDEDGNPVKLSDFFGKPIVLNFWAAWCYYCKEEMPDFDEVAKEHPEVQFLMIHATGTGRDVESAETGRKYVEQNGFEFDVFYDLNQDALSTYGISSFPTTFFIASNGDLYTYASGLMSRSNLEATIEKVKQYDERS